MFVNDIYTKKANQMFVNDIYIQTNQNKCL